MQGHLMDKQDYFVSTIKLCKKKDYNEIIHDDFIRSNVNE